MKYIKKIPKEDQVRTRELLSNGFQRLKEPKSIGAAMGVSLPLSVVLMVLNGLWCYFLDPSMFGFSNGNGILLQITVDLKILLYLAGIMAYTLVHEAIHAVFIPKVWESRKTYWGFNGMFGFVYSEEVLSRERFLLVSVMPLLILSFVFPLLMWTAGLWSRYMIFLSVLNAGGACVDLLNMILVAVQVPRKGKVVSNGYASFYKGLS